MTFNKVIEQDSSLIEFGNWEDFKEKIKLLEEKGFNSEKEMCDLMDMDFDMYTKLVHSAINSWRDSPSASLLNSIGKIGLNIPEEGQKVFNNLLDQTRFFYLLKRLHLLSPFLLAPAKDDEGNKIQVRSEYALTYRNPKDTLAVKKVNTVIQNIYLYAYFTNKAGEGIKLPKKLYRGVRKRDLHNFFDKVVMKDNEPIPKDMEYRERNKLKMDLISEYLKENGIKEICASNLVSFTSLKRVAEYFANDEGLVIEVDSKNVEIITSEKHDERFDVKDIFSGKKEKEYILRVKENLNVSEVYISDLDYLISINSPLCVSKFDHDNKSARYVLNGVRIKAYYSWLSNTKGRIYYRNEDLGLMSLSSTEFKKEYGFSPVITAKNLKDVQQFQVYVK